MSLYESRKKRRKDELGPRKGNEVTFLSRVPRLGFTTWFINPGTLLYYIIVCSMEAKVQKRMTRLGFEPRRIAPQQDPPL